MFDSRSSDIIYRWMTLKVIHNFPENQEILEYKDLKPGDSLNFTTDDGPSSQGSKFTHWEIKEGHINISDLLQLNITVEMIYDSAILEAIYKQMYNLTVNNGSGSGWYDPTVMVHVIADSDPTGKYFHHWYGGDYQDSFQDMYNRDTYFEMPYANCTIEAIYYWYYYQLTVIYGNGAGQYHYSEPVPISAYDRLSSEGLDFVNWVIDDDPSGLSSFQDANNPNTYYYMPPNDATIRATYQWHLWNLNIRRDGENDIITYNLHKGESHSIQAIDRTSDGYDFNYWAIDDNSNNPLTGGNHLQEDSTGNLEESVLSNTDINTTWKHGNRDYDIKAVYKWIIWDLNVRYDGENNITTYNLHKGQTQSISATDRSSDGYDFYRWQWDDGSNNPFSGNGVIPESASPDEREVIDNTSSNTTWRQGNQNDSIKATYQWHYWNLRIRYDGENGISNHALHKGETLNISATNRSSDGYDFYRWQWDDGSNNPLTGNGIIPQSSSPNEREVIDNTNTSTTWRQGNQDDSIKATYQWHYWNLSVRRDGENNIISYSLHKGQLQSISAMDRSSYDQHFNSWQWDDGTNDPLTGNGVIPQSSSPNEREVISNTSSNTTWRQGNQNDSIKAVYAYNIHTLTVINGSGDGNYIRSTNVNVVADSPPTGYAFDYWGWSNDDPLPEGTNEREIDNRYNSSATWKTGPQDDTIKAVYKKVLFHLTVNNGSGDGDYHYNDSVHVIADTPETGKEFDKWINGDGSDINNGSNPGEIDNRNNPDTYYHMPNYDHTIEATYKWIYYNLSVKDGSGDGSYHYKEEIGIDVDAGKSFYCWVWNNANNFDMLRICDLNDPNDNRCIKAPSPYTQSTTWVMGNQSDTIRASLITQPVIFGFVSEVNNYNDNTSDSTNWSAKSPPDAKIIKNTSDYNFVSHSEFYYDTTSSGNNHDLPHQIYNDLNIVGLAFKDNDAYLTRSNYIDSTGMLTSRFSQSDRNGAHQNNMDLDIGKDMQDDDQKWSEYNYVVDPNDKNVFYNQDIFVDKLAQNANFARYRAIIEYGFIANQDSSSSGKHWDGMLLRYKNYSGNWKYLMVCQLNTSVNEIFCRRGIITLDLLNIDILHNLALCVRSGSETAWVKIQIVFGDEA